MTGLFLRVGLVAIPLVLLAGTSAEGHEEAVRYTSFATIDLRPPLITGTLWLEFDAVEALYPVDRNDDMVYSEAELWALRLPVQGYLNERFLMMWQGRLHPLEVNRLERAKRRGMGHPFLKIHFTVRDLPPGAPVAIASRLLHDFSRAAKCMVVITREGRREVFVLGPRDYYRSDRSPLPKVPGSTYRPRSQRGRIAVAGDLRLEMLYAVPEGSFYLYILNEDRETPRGIEAQPIVASVTQRRRDENLPDTRKNYALLPRPLGIEKSGRCARFVLKVPQWKGVDRFEADLTLRSGTDRRRVVFVFPAVTILPDNAAATASARYACGNLCLGVASKDKSAPCMRCGARLIEVHGAPVPGVGTIGRHGGALRKLEPAGALVEALLPAHHELRLYVTDEEMKPRPVGKAAGKVHLWSERQPDEAHVEVALSPAGDGAYLKAKIPETIRMPFIAECRLALGDGGGGTVGRASFELHEIIELSEPGRPRPGDDRPRPGDD